MDAKKYGVIVENNGRRGLLLPDLEGVNTVQEQFPQMKKSMCGDLKSFVTINFFHLQNPVQLEYLIFLCQ